MILFSDVLARLKTILSQHHQRSKIKDKDIAEVLGLSPQYFAVIKRRNKVPYEAIANFCKKYNINMNWVLLEQPPKHLT
ncbi:MAG: helix-turn-helix domain containing protein [Sulfurovum sp.]|nr:helix-turn-helix domain containing protein [Sulfurovum sp.]MCB4763181.1 helix-turn-helix domain containing protein [Sulfurovum sp.]MCB4766016.1 helix-turn-helix domain containing protein [Sulfurovum sp.]